MIGNTDGYTCATDARFDVDEKNLSSSKWITKKNIYIIISIFLRR